jgi:outer membrane murein-binding lipoprotein Lpp
MGVAIVVVLIVVRSWGPSSGGRNDQIEELQIQVESLQSDVSDVREDSRAALEE